MKVSLFVFFPLLLLSQSASAVTVLASIKPLQLIASAITQGGAEPQLLLSPGSSPHDYALRPSDVRRIKQADLVLWVGPELETALSSVLAEQRNSLALMSQITLTSQAHSHEHESHQQDEHEHEHESHQQDEHGHQHNRDNIIIADQDHTHDHGTQDTHLWLDPHHANTIAQLLTKRLIALDPDNIDRYQDNLASFTSELTKTDQQVAAKLAPLADIGYFVFHDAYGYWERHYQLAKLGHFTINPARAPGAKTVSRIHHALRDSQAQCVFAEPQFKPAVVEAVIRNTHARIGVLDPLASQVEPGPKSYFAFMHQLADAMATCLINKPSTFKAK